MRFFITPIYILLISALVTGCGAVLKPYKHTGPLNIEIINDVDTGSFFSSFSNHFHVYKVKKDCSDITHLGGYEMTGKKKKSLSLPLNQLLVIEIAYTNTRYRTSTSFERKDAFVYIKKGEKLKFDFYFRENVVDLKLFKKKKSKEITIIPWSISNCKAITKRK